MKGYTDTGQGIACLSAMNWYSAQNESAAKSEKDAVRLKHTAAAETIMATIAVEITGGKTRSVSFV